MAPAPAVICLKSDAQARYRSPGSGSRPPPRRPLDDFPYVEFVHRGQPCGGPKLSMSDSASTHGPRSPQRLQLLLPLRQLVLGPLLAEQRFGFLAAGCAPHGRCLQYPRHRAASLVDSRYPLLTPVTPDRRPRSRTGARCPGEGPRLLRSVNRLAGTKHGRQAFGHTRSRFIRMCNECARWANNPDAATAES